MDYILKTKATTDLLLTATMDLLKTEQLNGEQWTRAKLGALLCFAVACALLAASLLAPQPVQVGDSRLMTGSVVQGR